MHCITGKQAQNFFVLNSAYESQKQDASVATHQALMKAGVANANLSMHQFIPESCEEISSELLQKGQSVEIMLGRAYGKLGETVSSGVCIAKLQRKGNKQFEGSLLCSYGAILSEEELKEELSRLVEELYHSGYDDIYEISEKRFITNSETITKNYGVSVTGICFTNFQQESYSCDNTKTRFLEYRCEYNDANYCFIPVAAETAYDPKGVGSAAAAIINMSTKLESYEVETDSQAYKAGFHTFSPIADRLMPEELVKETQKRVDAVMADRKIPVVLSGSSVAPIGGILAARQNAPDATLLSLNAKLNLRESFQGSPYHPYTIGNHGKKAFGNMVTIGARVCANREKNLFDPDNTWFSMDMIGDSMWVDDVLEEVNDEVYLSINANVFDPSVINAADTVADGLFIREVMPLFRKIARKKKIIGIDFHGLMPELGSDRSEKSAAQLIYKIVSYIEAHRETFVNEAAA